MGCGWQRFAKYCAGELTSIPWSELEGLQPETSKIDKKLVTINSQGFLTINSQPAVNGEKSDTAGIGTCDQFILRKLFYTITFFVWIYHNATFYVCSLIFVSEFVYYFAYNGKVMKTRQKSGNLIKPSSCLFCILGFRLHLSLRLSSIRGRSPRNIPLGDNVFLLGLFCRMGWSWWLCLSKGVRGVFHFTGEVAEFDQSDRG